MYIFSTVELSAIVHSSGIFVWWPQGFGMNVTHLTIEFQQIDRQEQPPRFTSEIVGTRTTSIDNLTWSEIELKLVNIPVQSINGDDPHQKSNSSITRVRVPGYTTGLLIPNANQVMVRVIWPVIDLDSGTELMQNNQYLQWTKVHLWFN